jgi:hypothetical protein
VDYKWLDERADLNGDGVVNFGDFAMFAGKWHGAGEAETQVDGYSFDTHETVDFNNVSRDISIGLRNIPSNVDEVFIYVDDTQIGKWVRDFEELSAFLESDKFTNGQHTIKLVSISRDGSVTNYRPKTVYFNNLLCKVSDDDEQYYPDRNYHYSGYYNGGNSLEATLTGLYDNVIWSNTYSGDYIDINIPGTAFGAEKICELNITETGGSGSASENLNKEFKWEDCENAKMLIMAPFKNIAKSRAPAIKACIQACEDHNVPWCYLKGHAVSWDNLLYLLPPISSNVKYIYYAGHADCNVVSEDKKTVVQRTCTMCWKYDPDAWFFEWEKIYVFSQTCIEPPLPDGWDYKGLDLRLLGMHESDKKKIVFIDGCNSADFNDMAAAYGMFSWDSYSCKDQIYIGWRTEVAQAELDRFYDDTTAAVKAFWERMGCGDSVGAALYWTVEHDPHGIYRQFMWGPNGVMNLFQVEGDDNIFLWGLGGTNKLYEIRLEP